MPVDPVTLAVELIKCPSVTPKESGTLSIIETVLKNGGFTCNRVERNGVSNLFARWGDKETGLNFCFNGHVDVVPAGDLNSWSTSPFGAEIKDGFLFGRGAADMKSGVAAFVAAAVNFVWAEKPHGSVVLTISGDEEGPAKDGTLAILDWMRSRNEKIDHCIVGEPTSISALGDCLKIGRRGSITFYLTAEGLQGHVAYPDKALNPLPAMTNLIQILMNKPLDKGSKHFSPSSLNVTTIDTGNTAVNVIPSQVSSTINIRFNDNHTEESIVQWVRQRIEEVTKKTGVNFDLTCKLSAEPFVTLPGSFSNLIAETIERELSVKTTLSTSGGTSDARFIKDWCPVVELGLLGETMHKIDEKVAVAQIHALSSLYQNILRDYFKQFNRVNSATSQDG